MDDWEAELERDRQRMAAGHDIEDSNAKKQPEQDEVSSYAGMMAYGSDAPPAGGDGYHPPPNADFAPPPPTESDSRTVEDFYASYEADITGSSAASVNPADLKPVTLQVSLQKLFGSKFGAKLYFCESVTMYLKGFFSPNTESYIMFATANAIYFGDPKTGELVLSRPYHKITEVLIMGDTGVGIRCQSSHDICLSIPANRSALALALPTAAGVSGVNVPVHTRSVDFEKGYRKDIAYVNRKDFTWGLEEDPRTGLKLIGVPEKHVPYYMPLVPKIMHWFGGANHIMKDWKGTNVQERRGCWVTATSLYLCLPSGPEADGRHITRCVGIEYVGEVFSGVGGAMAIVLAGGPKQSPLTLLFDDLSTKETVIDIFKAIYFYRRHEELKVTRVESIDKVLKIEKASDKKTRPELFAMKTRDDLLGLLRAKSK